MELHKNPTTIEDINLDVVKTVIKVLSQKGTVITYDYGTFIMPALALTHFNAYLALQQGNIARSIAAKKLAAHWSTHAEQMNKHINYDVDYYDELEP